MLTYKERISYCHLPIARKLLTLVDNKQTNLAFSADVTSANVLLELADLLGPEICVFKTHIDMIQDFTPDLIQQLIALSIHHQFLIFEDRKFADIGHTVKHQYAGGLYRIADWADLVTVHSLPGPGILQGLGEIAQQKGHALLLLAEMSSQGHLLDRNYQSATLAMAKAHPELVMGFITQHALDETPQWINMTPGVKLQPSDDKLGQCYVTPKIAIERGSDVLIVGRAILNTEDPLAVAKAYRLEGWQQYLRRCTMGRPVSPEQPY